MKRLFLLSAILTAFFTSSCIWERDFPDAESEVVISAAFQTEANTKAAVDHRTGKSEWRDGDDISAWTSASRFITLAYSGSNGSGKGLFKGQVTGSEKLGNTGYAIYPAGSHTFAQNKLSINLPSVYDYSSQTDYTADIKAPAVAQMGEVLAFKYVGGIIRVPIHNLPGGINKFVFKVSNNSAITGDFVVTNPGGSAPAIAKGSDSGKNSVSIIFPTSQEACDKEFLIPLPTGTYKGFTIELFDGDNLIASKSADTQHSLGRNQLASMSALSYEDGVLVFSNDDIIDMGDLPEVNYTLRELTDCTISIDDDATDWLSVTSEGMGGENSIITISAVPNPTLNSRSGVISFVDKNNSLKRVKVTVNQPLYAGMPLLEKTVAGQYEINGVQISDTVVFNEDESDQYAIITRNSFFGFRIVNIINNKFIMVDNIPSSAQIGIPFSLSVSTRQDGQILSSEVNVVKLRENGTMIWLVDRTDISKGFVILK